MKQPQITFRNEFANIRLTLEETRCGSRLLVEDRETGDSTYLDPIELASLCMWPEERHAELIQVGIYEYSNDQKGRADARP